MKIVFLVSGTGLVGSQQFKEDPKKSHSSIIGIQFFFCDNQLKPSNFVAKKKEKNINICSFYKKLEIILNFFFKLPTHCSEDEFGPGRNPARKELETTSNISKKCIH